MEVTGLQKYYFWQNCYLIFYAIFYEIQDLNLNFSEKSQFLFLKTRFFK